MTIDTINIGSLLKAFNKFEQFRQNLDTEQEQAGAIQAFEYCFELIWKTMKRLLETRGKIANSPREAFRMAGLEGFIKDPEIWFDFLKKRNITVHTYEGEVAQEVINVFPDFSLEARTFLKNIDTPSDLPYKVDIIDWNKCSESFKNTIKDDLIKIQ